MYVSRSEFHAALGVLWEQMEQFQKQTETFEARLKQQMETNMTSIENAFSDLDGVLGELEGDVTNLQQQVAAGNQAATQAAADQLEQRVAGIRQFLTSVSGTTTPPASTGTDTGTATGGDTSAPTDGSTTPPASA